MAYWPSVNQKSCQLEKQHRSNAFFVVIVWMSSTCSFNYKLFKIFIVVVPFSENKIKVLLKLDDTIHLISNTKESCLCLIKHKLYLVLVLGHILFSYCRFSQELKEIHFSSLSLKIYLREMEIQFFLVLFHLCLLTKYSCELLE